MFNHIYLRVKNQTYLYTGNSVRNVSSFFKILLDVLRKKIITKYLINQRLLWSTLILDFFAVICPFYIKIFQIKYDEIKSATTCLVSTYT